MIIAFFFVLVLAVGASAATTIGKYQRTRLEHRSPPEPLELEADTHLCDRVDQGTCFSGDSCGAGISFDVSGDPGTTIPINGEPLRDR